MEEQTQRLSKSRKIFLETGTFLSRFLPYVCVLVASLLILNIVHNNSFFIFGACLLCCTTIFLLPLEYAFYFMVFLSNFAMLFKDVFHASIPFYAIIMFAFYISCFIRRSKTTQISFYGMNRVILIKPQN